MSVAAHMPSITYYIILLVLKLKGVKENFSRTPFDVGRLRKEDVPVPSKKLLLGASTSTFKIEKTTVTEIIPSKGAASDYLLLYCPGGAYVYGPTELNWKSIAHLAESTRTKAWLLNYPKAPETNIQEIAVNIDEVYAEALKSYPPSKIILIGDSVGGSLLLSLVQRLVKAGEETPGKLILISPVLDASMSNPKIDQIDKVDPILCKCGVLSAKKLCAGDVGLKNPIISPLYGSFRNFPATHVFIAENDIMMPDQKLAVGRMLDENVKVEVIDGKSMPHIWPLLPVMKEAKLALKQMEAIINHTTQKV
ncbi:alpha/beta hydrolase fold domain-containing protein [Pontibacter toksunensis]|uniref:Alpha/beta hydrolase fold domain-containing protein n=1 Tax=Pontibacter toksunensis TaxID=1332631 RepID=A0ABW6BWG0_9BACT